MDMASVFRGIIEFFDKLGIYDVVLPFLLVFTIVFAILEKTKVLGTEKIKGYDHPITKKNLNSMVAFVVGFFVIASSQLVEIITKVSANMVVLLLLSIFFLLLVGSFWKETDEPFSIKDLGRGWVILFTVIMFIGIISIFLMAIETPGGTPWLVWFLEYIQGNWNSTIVGSVILMGIIIGFMFWVVKSPAPKKEESKS